MRRIELAIGVVGAGEALTRGAREAIAHIAAPTGEDTFDVGGVHVEPSPDEPVLARAVHQARAFFANSRTQVGIRIVEARTLDDLALALRRVEVEGRAKSVCMVVLEANDDDTPESIESQLVGFRAAMGDTDMRVPDTQYANVVWFSDVRQDGLVMGPRSFAPRVLPIERWVQVCDVLCLVTDFLQILVGHPRALRGVPQPVTLGVELGRFLDERAEAGWDLYYFTGSMVQSLIRTLEGAAAEPAMRGPSEHSLACGALANFMLRQRRYVIVVTSAMLDEFKGTLANLRDADAKGFIVCAENDAQDWFAFQGTLSAREDMREVVKARGLACVHLESADRLGEDLSRAFELHERTPGPTILLASGQVLEHVRALPEPIPRPAPTERRLAVRSDDQAHLDEVMRLLNEDPVRVMWQCGPMTDHTLARVLSIAERSGIALADSLIHPGTVPAVRDRERVPSYLGPLGIYGFGKAAHEYLCTGGKIRPREEQVVFFLGSRLGQVASPFAHSKLRHVQVIGDPGLLAPFAEHPVCLDPEAFIAYVDRHLDVDPGVRARRLEWLDEARSAARPDLLSDLPSIPMSPNFFFGRVDEVVGELIRDHGYTYTGAYDVGRCGASALRNVSRTGPGFSGWFGRALMGDALMASLGLAQRDDGNLVVFAGDGARALVPDVLSPLAEAARAGALRARNITVVCLLNGALSLIQSYQEGFLARGGDRQVQIANVAEPERDFVVGGYTFETRRVATFDADVWRERLMAEHRVNLVSVVVGHNNVGDGMSLVSERGWQSDTRLSEPATTSDSPRGR